MPLQNFIDGSAPVIGATWLNKVDRLMFTVFQEAATVNQALSALGFSAYGISLTTAADAAAARTALGASATGTALFVAASASSARSTLGATTVGGNLFTAADADAARSTLGATSVGEDLFTAANAAAARSTLGIAYPYDFLVACSDETTNLGVANGVVSFVVRRSFTLSAVYANLNTASSSGAVGVDVTKGGVSIFSTAITIDEGETDSATAATQPVLSTTTFTTGNIISVNITAAGTGADGLKLVFVGTAT